MRTFRNGQTVEHVSWTDPSGKPLRGTVRIFDDAGPGEAEGEVQWHGTCVADELELVQHNLR